MRRLFAHLRTIHESRFVRYATGASFAMIALGVAGMLWQLYPNVLTQQVVPLHYNIHFGVDRVGPGWRLFIPSLVAVVLTLANMLSASAMWQRERVVALAFVVASLLVNVLVLLHIVFIVLLNLAYV